MNAAREELAHRLTSEQQDFFGVPGGDGGALESGVTDARKKVEKGI